jgi:Flp pilus assembly protein TadD
MSVVQKVKWAGLLLGAMWLAACSKDPNKYLASGDKYFKAGKYQEAVIQYRNAIQLNPKLAQAHYELSRAYFQLKSPAAAYRELRETVTLDPENSDAQLEFATLLIGGKKYDEAKAAAAKVLAANPRSSRAHAILGDEFALTGDWAGAIREYRTAITLEPQRVESYSSLAAVYTSRGDFTDAEAAFKQGAEANPKSVQALLNLGIFYSTQRKFAQAEAEMEAASKLAPRGPFPRLWLANDYAAKGNFAGAEKVTAELKTAAPDDPRAYRALALFYLSIGQREKAVAELWSLSASRPKDAWVKGCLAGTLLDLNRVEEASVPTQQLLGAYPNDPGALLFKGRILIAQRKYEEARNALQSSIKGAPRSGAAYYFLGVAQKSLALAVEAKASFAQAHKLSPQMLGPEAALAELDATSGAYGGAERLAEANPKLPLAEVIGAWAELARGNLSKAEQLVETALDRDPVSLPALEILVKLDAANGKAQEATRRLSALVSEYPKSAGLHFLLAASYFDSRDLQKSEENVRQAIALDAQTPDAHALLAEIDNAKGLGAQAEEEYKAEIAAYPHKASVYMALAHLYETGSRWADAKAVLEKAIAADPAYPDVKNNLAYLYLEHGGDVNIALSLAQDAKRALPNSPVVADTLGWALYKMGSYASAIPQLIACVQKVPGNPEYQYHLGMAYLGAQRFAPAAESLERALRGDGNAAYAASARAALDTISKRSRK